MHIYILYSLVIVLFIIVTFLAVITRINIRRMATKVIKLMHMLNIHAYDLALYIVATLDQKGKTTELTQDEQASWHKARSVINNFERDYKVRETDSEK